MRADGGDVTAQAAVRVSTELLGLLPDLARSPLQAVARMHTLAAKGVVDDSDLGRPRDAVAAARLHDLARLLSQPHCGAGPRGCRRRAR